MNDDCTDDYDPNWSIAPCIGAFLAVLTAPVVYFVLGLGLLGIADSCPEPCSSQMSDWYWAVFCAVSALVLAVAMWFGPRTRRYRKHRWWAVAVMEGMALISIAGVFAIE